MATKQENPTYTLKCFRPSRLLQIGTLCWHGTLKIPVDPLASPPQDLVDVLGHTLDPSQVASLSLDGGSETHSLFSQKNLLRLAALNDSHRTLSLFTPGIRDAVFRAWAGPTERGESHTPFTPAMSRKHSHTGLSSTTYTFQDSTDPNSRAGRPTLTSFGSAASGLGVGSSRGGKAHGGRKCKHRVVNLRRREADTDELESVSGDGSTMSGNVSSAPSELAVQCPKHEREDELTTPPKTPEKQSKPWQHSQGDLDGIDLRETPPRLRDLTPRQPIWQELDMPTPRPAMNAYTANPLEKPPQLPMPSSSSAGLTASLNPGQQPPLPIQSERYQYGLSAMPFHSSTSPTSLNAHGPRPEASSSGVHLTGRIYEQAWMLKMAGEIARKMNEEKAVNPDLWHRHEVDEPPPPAYGL